MSKKNNVNRLNTKQQTNKSGLILIGTFVLWLVLFLDMIFIAHNDPFIIIVVSVGIWVVGLLMVKPGKFAMQVQQVGFWKAVFGSGSNQQAKRGRRRR